MRFDGSDYDPAQDNSRLVPQYERVFGLMQDGEWRTLEEISAVVKAPSASVSAQLRHMRKERFGSHDVQKRTRGERKGGLYEYRVIVNCGGEEPCWDAESGELFGRAS